ncbi:unnamed protein product [Prorocentrum cordatum]|uniref:EF-hand domain-containing protein n=1 Tax=Prorocentrum cordatum TaxID=2364126 RepID=A0ABN9XG54_9DINO|nr:unnamed protein product [Polarella glacialis]
MAGSLPSKSTGPARAGPPDGAQPPLPASCRRRRGAPAQERAGRQRAAGRGAVRRGGRGLAGRGRRWPRRGERARRARGGRARREPARGQQPGARAEGAAPRSRRRRRRPEPGCRRQRRSSRARYAGGAVPGGKRAVGHVGRSAKFTQLPLMTKQSSTKQLVNEVQDLSSVTAAMSSHEAVIAHGSDMDVNPPSKLASREIREWTQNLTSSSHFETVVAVSIISNAVATGWNSDWVMRNLGSDRPMFFIVLDWVFLSVFMLELLFRMVAEWGHFFHYRAKMFKWNIFDTIIIALTFLNNAEILGVRFSVVRVFRVLRLVRLIRVVRLMDCFRELRMMVDGILNCGKVLLWAFLLLVLVTFTYAVVCLEFISEWLAQVEQDMRVSTAGSGLAEQETITFVKDNYQSLPYSVYTLFKAVSGGVNWSELVEPLADVDLILVCTFPFFIGVTVYCVLNIVTASFVEAAARSSKDEQANALEIISERKRWIKDITDIFKRHDADSCGFLDFEEFSSIMTDWRTQAAFTDMGIDLSFQQAKDLFKLFDWDGDGQIDINEFAQGVHHLRGPARSLDVFRQFMKLSRTMEKIERSVQNLAGPQIGPRSQKSARLHRLMSSESSVMRCA